MGCQHSLPLDNNRMFYAKNVNEKDRGRKSVILEVKNQRLFVYNRRFRKQIAAWPILGLKKYGCNKECLVIETNVSCDNGAGTYIFKSTNAYELFRMVADVWQEVHEKRVQLVHQQNQVNNVMFNPALFHQQQQAHTAGIRQHEYYNTNRSQRSHQSSNVNTPRTNGSVPFRGSCSSKGNIPNLDLDTGLTTSQRSMLGPAFELQPAPATRAEMLHRRRINSGVTFCRDTESVFMGCQRPRHRSAMPEADYENNEIIARQHDATSPLFDPNHDAILEQESPGSEHQPTTPGSNGTSGISSLNENSTTSESKSQTQCNFDDPWRPKPINISRSASAKKHRNKLFLRQHELYNMPMSAREYVNTANASMDVSGTPIPATAMVSNGATHFSFDFDHHSYSASSSCGNSHKNLNYVPIEVSMKNGGFYSCGTSSASSGLGPATPVTPPPKTPNGHSNTQYAIIDHHKTRALSDAHKHRQRERKSCRKNSENRPMIPT